MVGMMDRELDARMVGIPGDSFAYEIRRESIAAYAAVVGAAESDTAPPLYAALPPRDAVASVLLGLAAPSARERVVHLAHELVVHRRLVAGSTVVTRATPTALQPRSTGTLAVIRVVTETESGEPVNEQAISLYFRGVHADAPAGEPVPDRAESNAPPDAELSRIRVPADLPDRYAEASGDHFEIHTSDAFARGVGLRGRIVHGMCTLALAVRETLAVTGTEGLEVSRIAAEFASPLYPGDELATSVWRRSPRGWSFQAHSGESLVLAAGVVELGAEP